MHSIAARRSMTSMPHRRLGRDGPTVGPLCLGAMFFGTRVAEADAFAILDRYVERGGTFIDTADNYAFWEPGGVGDESELVLGRWLRSRGCRADVVLATKVGARPMVAGTGFETAEGLSAAAIRSAIDESLRRLGTDHVELLYAHVDDRAVSLEETLQAFTAVVDAGKAGSIGASNFRAWRLALAQELSARNGFSAYCCVQQRSSYLQPRPRSDLGVQVAVDDDLLDLCAATDTSILAYSPLLSGAYVRSDVELNPAYRSVDNQHRLKAAREVAREIGATANQVVLAWLRQSSGRHVVPVIAASSLGQLDENLDAAGLRLDEAQLAALQVAGSSS
jgi:aryl-alcohol dehydrogenase-like predicted oxidoreductase